MAITPDYGTQKGGFFKNLRADIRKLSKPDNTEPGKAGDTGNTYKDYRDALATKDYAESVKNLSLALMTMEPPTVRRIDGVIESKDDEIPEECITDDEGSNYFFLDTDYETSPDDYADDDTEFLPEPKEMTLEDFLKETEGGDFDILPVLYNINYSSNGAFMPEKIDKIILPNPERGDQIVLYSKDGKRAFIDFVTGRRIFQVPDENGNYETKLIDDDGYKLNEDTYFLYSRAKEFWL